MEPIDLRASGHDAFENIRQIFLGVDLREFGRVDQRRKDRPSLAAARASGEQMILRPSPIGRMLRSTVLLSISMRPSSRKRVSSCPMRKSIADCLGQT